MKSTQLLRIVVLSVAMMKNVNKIGDFMIIITSHLKLHTGKTKMCMKRGGYTRRPIMPTRGDETDNSNICLVSIEIVLVSRGIE
jgi:hypothetical protein